MSLSWLDWVDIFVHPERVVVERQRFHGASSRQVVHVAQPVEGEDAWVPVVKALQLALTQDGSTRGRVRLMVADHFVRYTMLPWGREVVFRKGRQNVAKALFMHALGERASALEIAVDTPTFGASGVASGIDRSFLAQLRSSLSERKMSIASLQPRFVKEVNLSLRGARNYSGWFACVDRQRLTLASLSMGRLQRVRNQRTTPGSLQRDLFALLNVDAREGRQLNLTVSSDTLPEPISMPGWTVEAFKSTLPGVGHA